MTGSRTPHHEGKDKGTSSLAGQGAAPLSDEGSGHAAAHAVWRFGYVHPAQHVQGAEGRMLECPASQTGVYWAKQDQAPTALPSKLFIEGCSMLAGSSCGSWLSLSPGPGPNTGVQYICCWTNACVCVCVTLTEHRVPCGAAQEQCPCLCHCSPQHCRIRAVLQGPIPESTSCTIAWSWPPAALKLQGLSTLLSMFLSGIRAGKPGYGPSHLGEEELLLGRVGSGPHSLIAWGAAACSGGVTSAFSQDHQP